MEKSAYTKGIVNLINELLDMKQTKSKEHLYLM